MKLRQLSLAFLLSGWILPLLWGARSWTTFFQDSLPRKDNRLDLVNFGLLQSGFAWLSSGLIWLFLVGFLLALSTLRGRMSSHSVPTLILLSMLSVGWLFPIWKGIAFFYQYVVQDLFPSYFGRYPLTPVPLLDIAYWFIAAGGLWLMAVLAGWAICLIGEKRAATATSLVANRSETL